MLRFFAISFALFCAADNCVAQSNSTAGPSSDKVDSSITAAAAPRVTNLSGGVVDQQVTLNWVSLNEAGIREFVIEHASGTGIFEKVGSIQAKGGGKYSYRYKATPGQSQTRIRLVKLNGEALFSAPLRLSVHAGAATLEASPNPASGLVQIQGLSYGDQGKLIAANGQTVRSFMAARTAEQLNLEGLPAGVYLLQVYSAEGEARPGLRIVKR